MDVARTPLDGGAGLDQVLAQVEDITAERTAQEALAVAERVRTASSQMLVTDGPRVATTLGRRHGGPAGQPTAEVLAAADRALHAAKQAGRHRSRLG